eukprot:3856635-Amphidinium_carterae.1
MSFHFLQELPHQEPPWNHDGRQDKFIEVWIYASQICLRLNKLLESVHLGIPSPQKCPKPISLRNRNVGIGKAESPPTS